jgi:hypothetical protein
MKTYVGVEKLSEHLRWRRKKKAKKVMGPSFDLWEIRELKLCFVLRTLSIHIPLLGLVRFFSFLIFTQSVRPLGRGISPSQSRYIYTGQHKHRINAHGHPCHRPRDHCDRPLVPLCWLPTGSVSICPIVVRAIVILVREKNATGMERDAFDCGRPWERIAVWNMSASLHWR